jgi:cytochrome c oxidase assembly protein subunit 11|tara:strand:- start:1036 stop:1608 length:573 start_codon:yes stop_codon:yes gene_type:complete
MTNANTRSKGISATVKRLCLMVVGMGLFVVALVPLYDLLCEITGLNGKTGGQYTFDEAQADPDTSRLIKVNFITNTNAGMVWDFWSQKSSVRVHPGQIKTVNFYVKNPTNRPMVGQAIPSVMPSSAASFFHKTECFCFNQQLLQPGEVLEMPMRFIVGHEVPQNVQSINLSYALFDVTERVDLSEAVAAN